MAISLAGNGGTVAEVDGTTWRALRVTGKPNEVGAGGYFRTTLSGTTAAAPAAAANLASLRWTSATLFAAIRFVELHIQVSTASTAGLPELAGYVARTFSTSDSGGTAVTLGTNGAKMKTAFGASLIASGDLRYATGGVLTAGTRTLDGQPFIICSAPLALGLADRATFDLNDVSSDHPIVLAQNEGLVFQNTAALTAGAYRFNITIGWCELPSY